MKCPPPKLVYKKEWTKHDQDTLERAKEQCKVFYGDKVCVRIIEKTEEGSYKVRCFEPEKIEIQEVK